MAGFSPGQLAVGAAPRHSVVTDADDALVRVHDARPHLQQREGLAKAKVSQLKLGYLPICVCGRSVHFLRLGR